MELKKCMENERDGKAFVALDVQTADTFQLEKWSYCDNFQPKFKILKKDAAFFEEKTKWMISFFFFLEWDVQKNIFFKIKNREKERQKKKKKKK